MGTPGQDARKLAKVVNHPIRSKIIEMLGKSGPLTWKELSTQVGVRTGALYHHLDILEGLVERDSSKRYLLTKHGAIVYSRISESHTIDSVQDALDDIGREGRHRRMLISIVSPRSPIGVVTSDPRRSLATLLLATLTLAALGGALGLSPVLYYVRPDATPLLSLGGLLVSLGAVAAVSYVALRFAFRARVEPIAITAASVISFIPVFISSSFGLLAAVHSFLTSSSAVYTLLLVIFQSWSAVVLGAGLSVVSGVRIEKTVLVGLGVLYATMAGMLALGAAL